MLRNNSLFIFPSGKCVTNNMRNQMTGTIKIKKMNGLTIRAIASDVCSGVMPKV